MDSQLTPEAITALLVVAYLLGVALRIIWPFALAYFRDGAKFDVNYIIGQVIAAIIGLFGVMASADFVQSLGAVGFFGAFVAGYGAASIGRESQKTVKR